MTSRFNDETKHLQKTMLHISRYIAYKQRRKCTGEEKSKSNSTYIRVQARKHNEQHAYKSTNITVHFRVHSSHFVGYYFFLYLYQVTSLQNSFSNVWIKIPKDKLRTSINQGSWIRQGLYYQRNTNFIIYDIPTYRHAEFSYTNCI